MKIKYLKAGIFATVLFAIASCTGGNQGMNEAGSADSNSMMNVDTQYVDTSGATKPGVDSKGMDNGEASGDSSALKGKNQVPVPSP